MSEIGRNDLCHCGSGKKYKKCCLASDLEKSREISPKNNTSETYNKDYVDEDVNYNDDDSDEYFNDLSDKENIEKENAKPGLPMPEISKEDKKYLDDWYEKYDSIENSIEKLEFIQQFIINNPGLINACGIESETLIDLKSEFYKANQAQKIINFIEDFRHRFPEIYLREFGYHDFDLVCYYISKGNEDKINKYFEFFFQYPTVFPDKLFELIEVLILSGYQKVLTLFLKEKFNEIIDSNEIFGGNDILNPLILQIWYKHLKADSGDDDFSNMAYEVSELGDYVIDDYKESNFWKNEHDRIYAQPGIFQCNLSNQKSAKKAYVDFGMKFMCFLMEEYQIDLLRADYINIRVLEYLLYTIRKNIVKKRTPFVLNEKLVDEFIASEHKRYFWIDPTRTVGFLTGLWHFVEFLHRTGNADENEIERVHQFCLKLFLIQRNINSSEISLVIFENMPLF